MHIHCHLESFLYYFILIVMDNNPIISSCWHLFLSIQSGHNLGFSEWICFFQQGESYTSACGYFTYWMDIIFYNNKTNNEVQFHCNYIYFYLYNIYNLLLFISFRWMAPIYFYRLVSLLHYKVFVLWRCFSRKSKIFQCVFPFSKKKYSIV